MKKFFLATMFIFFMGNVHAHTYLTCNVDGEWP